MTTGKAKSKIKSVLKEDKKKLAQEGERKFKKWLKKNRINNTEDNIRELQIFFRLTSPFELFYKFEIERLNLKRIDEIKIVEGKIVGRVQEERPKNELEERLKQKVKSEEMLVIGESMDNFDYKISPCCNPIPGDEVFGFITIQDGIKIHKINCPNAVQLMSNYAYRIVKARWTSQQKIAFLAGIKITGIDDVGLVNNITKLISDELNVNMRSISFDSNDGVFEGTIMIYVHDTKHLKQLVSKMKMVNGVINVSRIDG